MVVLVVTCVSFLFYVCFMFVVMFVVIFFTPGWIILGGRPFQGILEGDLRGCSRPFMGYWRLFGKFWVGLRCLLGHY